MTAENKKNDQPTTTEPQRIVAEISELAGGLAHELRNPLSTMMINLKLLAEDLRDADASPEDVKRRALLKVNILRQEADRLQNLFDDFLNVTGKLHVQRTTGDLCQVVDGLAEFFEPSARSNGLELTVEHAQRPLLCLFDENLIRQALLNLLINAQQAMSKGGILRLVTARTGDRATVSVIDAGVGISPADRQRILRPFFSSKGDGNGLGLSITQRILEEHDGSLSFESELGKGTTFTVTIPLAETAPGPLAETAPEPPTEANPRD